MELAGVVEMLEALAVSWAARLSTDDYTHSLTGTKLNDGWATSEAMQALQPIAALASHATPDQRMYLLIEASSLAEST